MTICVIFSLVVLSNWPLNQLDTHNVFMHGDLEEVVYMRQPHDFVNHNFSNHVCKIKKAIYGLKQVPHA